MEGHRLAVSMHTDGTLNSSPVPGLVRQVRKKYPAPCFNFSLKNVGPFWANVVAVFSLWTTSPLAVRDVWCG